MPALGEYLKAVGGRRAPANCVIPCALFAADWVVACGRPDPLAFMRADTERQAQRRLIQARLRLLPLAQRGMSEAQVPEVDEPRTGDVGVIERPTVCGLDEACAIYGDGRWITLGLYGIEAGPGDALMVWRP
jgi:hypothetical protein